MALLVIAGAAVGLTILLVGAWLNARFKQLNTVRQLKSRGVDVYLSNMLDEHAREVKTWSWMDELFFPRDAYVRVDALDFRGVVIQEHDLKLIANLPYVRHINLQDTNFGDSDVPLVTDLPALTHLVLHGTHITDASLSDLARAQNLLAVDLTDTRVTMEEKEWFLRQLPTCELRELTADWADREPIVIDPFEQ